MSSFSLFAKDDQPSGRYGEGISRATPDLKNRPFKVKVLLRGSLPMLFTQEAASLDDAIRFAQNRWPDARIEPTSTQPEPLSQESS